MAVGTDGTLWAWGSNAWGKLGNDSNPNFGIPKKIGSETTWLSVAGGYHHTVALRADRTLWAWGNNDQNQLGDGTREARSSPIQVGTDNNWKTVRCGNYHTVAILNDGSLWSWGSNRQGQLGYAVAGTGPMRIGSDTDWADVACGAYHTLALKTDGTIWSWGLNDEGQLGIGTKFARSTPLRIGNSTSWVSIACGERHSSAVQSDGTLWEWGLVFYPAVTVPTQVGTDSDWATVSCGSFFSLAVRTDGTLWGWGQNDLGQLGDGTMLNRTQPVPIGADSNWSLVASRGLHTSALRTDGSIWSWGSNAEGVLGIGSLEFKRTWPSNSPQSIHLTLEGRLGVGELASLNCFSSSGLPVSITVVGPASLDGANNLQFHSPGKVTISAYQHGDSAWAAAESVSKTFLVSYLPEIEVTSRSNTIQSGDNTPDLETGTHFGVSTLGGQSVSRSFVVRNKGAAPLSLTGEPEVVITGANSSDFTVEALPSKSILEGTTTEFTISFSPSAAGLRSANVTLFNNDPSSEVFSFTIGGVGIGLTTYPAFNITGNSASIRGSVTNDGGITLNTRGFLIGSTAALTHENSVAIAAVGTGAGAFNVDLTGLNSGRTYHLRSYASNEFGVTYGEEVFFTTESTVVFDEGIATYNGEILPTDRHRYWFEVLDPRFVTITSIEFGLQAELRGSGGELIAFSTGEKDFILSALLHPGAYRLEVRRPTGTASVAGYSIEIDASIVAQTRPDISVGTNPIKLSGGRIFAEQRQRINLFTKKLGTVSAFSQASNRGILPDTLLVRGDRGSAYFRTSYFAPSNITSAIISGRYSTKEIFSPGREVGDLLRVAIVPNKSKLRKGSSSKILRKSVLIRIACSSTYDPRIQDSAVISVQSR